MVASQLIGPPFCYYVVTRSPALWNEEGKPREKRSIAEGRQGGGLIMRREGGRLKLFLYSHFLFSR
jgi:hypothetical protein